MYRYRAVIKKHLEGNALLLYYTSVDLLNTVDPAFARIIAEYWEEKLGLGANNFAAKLTREEQESRRIVLSLITSGVTRGGGGGGGVGAGVAGVGPAINETPLRTHRAGASAGINRGGSSGDALIVGRGVVAAGKRLALASEGHLRLLPGIILRETHFAQEEIFVEETNFESVLLRLKRASPAALTFVFVYITGRISADQINQFVSVPASTLKLIFRCSQSLVNLLDLTPSIRDIIHQPESITHILAGRMQEVNYSAKSAVGAMVLFNAERLSEDPCAIARSGPFWDETYPEDAVRRAARWKEDIQNWVMAPINDNAGPDEFLRIIVTPDHAITTLQLLQAFDALEPRPVVRTVDAGDRSKVDELKAFVDNRACPSFSFSRFRETPTPRPPLGEASEIGVMQGASEVFILRRATFLPHARLEVLVSRCYSRRTKLILLSNEAVSSISRFRVFKDSDPSSPPVWVRVPILTQRLTRPCNILRVDLTFVGLQLLLSHSTVVSDEHYKAVEQFLDTPSDISALSFLDHIEGVPADRGVRSSFILALASVDDTSVIPDALIKRATLAEILSMHINRYIRSQAGAQHLCISFDDFSRQPRVRFLSQIHRIEAYICYIFSKTDENRRLSARFNSEYPLGFPLIACFPDLIKNVHCPLSPGAILSSQFEIDSINLPEGKLMVPAVKYIDPGRGDVVTHMQEIIEHQAINGAELHWEDMFAKWQSGPEITDDILDHVLIHSPSRLSVLLCMTPPQVVNLGLSSEALRVVSHDFDNCQDSFRRLGHDDFRVLRTRAAAIWWLLLTKGGVFRQSSEAAFAEDQSLLIDSGIYFEPKAPTDESDSTDFNQLCIRVASAMLSLDRSDIWTSQHTVRNFFLSNTNAEVVTELLSNESIMIGQAFVNACVSSDTLNSIFRGAQGMALADKMINILSWVKSSTTANLEGMVSEMRFFASRFTPLALSCLLLSANPPVDLNKAREGILRPCIQFIEENSGETAAKTFLAQILKPFCTERNRGSAVCLFEILMNDEQFYRFPIPNIPDVLDTWNAMFVTMSDPSHARTLFQKARDENFLLPFEASPKLCEIYVEHFGAEGRDLRRDLDEHSALLDSDLSRDAIYKYITGANINPNQSILCLLWFTWWSSPWTSLSLRYMPKNDSWDLFQSVARKATVTEEKVHKHGLSTIARFTIAPHTLPASMVNALKCAMVDGRPLILSEKYVLAQMGSCTYPVYGFRSHTRHLPKECIDAIREDMQGRRLAGFTGRDPASKFKEMFPITDSGVSVDIVQHNLNILVHIHETSESLEVDKTPEMRAQIFLPTLSWFFSAGFRMLDLKSMCLDNDKRKLAQNYTTMVSTWSQADFPRALVYCPLPVYIDVRYVSGKGGALFQCGPESVNNTVQWLAMLDLQYNLEGYNAADYFQEYAEEGRFRRQDSDRPKAIIRDVMFRVAKDLVRRNAEVKIGNQFVGKYHVVFVLDESGSMEGQPWNSVVDAVKDFLNVRLLVGADDIISLITFNGSARIACQLIAIEDCHQQLSSLRFHGGGTRFAPALSRSQEVLIRGREQHPDHKPVLLFMSDGASCDGERDGDIEMQVLSICIKHSPPPHPPFTHLYAKN